MNCETNSLQKTIKNLTTSFKVFIWFDAFSVRYFFLYSRLQSHWAHYQMSQLFRFVRFCHYDFKFVHFLFYVAKLVTIVLTTMVSFLVLESKWVVQNDYLAWMGIKIKLLQRKMIQWAAANAHRRKFKPEESNNSSNEKKNLVKNELNLKQVEYNHALDSSTPN